MVVLEVSLLLVWVHCLDETPGSEKVEGSPASGQDGNETTGIGVMSTGFVNIFYSGVAFSSGKCG